MRHGIGHGRPVGKFTVRLVGDEKNGRTVPRARVVQQRAERRKVFRPYTTPVGLLGELRMTALVRFPIAAFRAAMSG